MGLEALLSKLENREPETPATPCNPARVTANPALSLACTPETPETPQIDNGGCNAKGNTGDKAPIPVCKTCVHVTGHGGCGEPVAAGLSDQPGVIRYSPDQGATCHAWQARIDADLERHILAMAERWNDSGDELALAMTGARFDLDGMRRVVESDEEGK